MRASISLIIALFASIATSPALADEVECFDLKIRAKPVAQIPTAYPRSDDPLVIIMSWPWFMDFDVRQVIEGDFKGRKLTALAVLHVGYRPKVRTWILRRNTLGGFNVLRMENPDAVPKCHSEIEPAEPYLRPGPGRTLEDFRRESEEELKRYYDDDSE